MSAWGSQSVKKMPTLLTSTAIDWASIPPQPNPNGTARPFFDGPTQHLANLECHATTLNPGAANHEILQRPHDEIVILKEGTIEAYLHGTWLPLSPGSVIFYAAGTDQALRNPTPSPATYHVITFRPAPPK